jgi:hypothetical protein
MTCAVRYGIGDLGIADELDRTLGEVMKVVRSNRL